MPYTLDGNCVKKVGGGTVPGGCHKTHEEALAHLRALEANVNNSSIVEMSLRITKASYNKSDGVPMKWAAIDSDVDEDLYKEKMSVELYKDFVSRIENKTPIPDEFQEVICESDWCGGMPYLSIAHYKAGTGRLNVPGNVEGVYIDGTRLKSKGTLHNNEMGRKVFDALREDLYMEKSGNKDHSPVRISIGFLDLEHKHVAEAGGQDFTFTRKSVGDICPLCSQGIGGKIYMKGQLVHLALTRVPVNPRTRMMTEKAMAEEIMTKKDDAKSIIGDLAEGLEEKSLANDVLVVRSDGEPTPDPSMLAPCYDPNTDSYNQECIDAVMDKFMPEIRNQIGQPVNSKSLTKGGVEAVVAYLYKSNGIETPVEEPMETVEKGVAGIPEKPFSHTQFGVTITGDGNNQTSAPVKSDAEEAETPEEEKKEKMEEKSSLDTTFDSLKSMIAKGASVEEVQAVFNSLGTEVEKSLAPKSQTPSGDSAEIIALRSQLTALSLEMATLKAQVSGKAPVENGGVVKSKALNINHFTDPNQMIAKAVTGQVGPVKQLSQIERLARATTGLE